MIINIETVEYRFCSPDEDIFSDDQWGLISKEIRKPQEIENNMIAFPYTDSGNWFVIWEVLEIKNNHAILLYCGTAG